MKLKVLGVAILLMVSCNTKKTDSVAINEVKAEIKVEAPSTDIQGLEIYDFEGLKPFLNEDDDKIHVINFWATWCRPCVKELPYFEALYEKYKNNDVEVVLVSLDFPHQFESKLKPFIKEKQLKSKVIVLDDVDSNSWIPQVDKDWSGSIPATIIYKKGKRSFFERSFTYNELENALKHFLN